MTDYQHNHYYVQKDGRDQSDFETLQEAHEYVRKNGGTIAVEVVGELDCE